MHVVYGSRAGPQATPARVWRLPCPAPKAFAARLSHASCRRMLRCCLHCCCRKRVSPPPAKGLDDMGGAGYDVGAASSGVFAAKPPMSQANGVTGEGEGEVSACTKPQARRERCGCAPPMSSGRGMLASKVLLALAALTTVGFCAYGIGRIGRGLADEGWAQLNITVGYVAGLTYSVSE
jgi:hypothetical protein